MAWFRQKATRASLGFLPLRGHVWGAFALTLVIGAACNRKTESERASVLDNAAASAQPVSSSELPPAPENPVAKVNPYETVESTKLLELPVSAFRATLGLDDEAIFLLTADTAYRLVPGQPPRQFPLDLGYGATVMRSSILFWSKQAIWKANKQDGKARRIAKLPQQPQYFVSSGDDFAWIERNEQEGRYRVSSLDGTKPRVLYESANELIAAAMLNDWVFFVDRPDDASWRVGAVRTGGGAPVFSAPKTGRTPSMLAAWRDIYLYEGATRNVLKLSPDLRHEETVIRDFVCSPLAVFQNVYCAHVEGLSAISPSDPTPQRVIDNVWGAISRIAANANRVVWLNDAGQDKLALRMIELPNRK
ncbi:MAG TPA: hypothetical protein VFQ61_00940 [Polyangiaceae bacterium]|nr:hypothetical protein [Polyangiaceae bacterium]